MCICTSFAERVELSSPPDRILVGNRLPSAGQTKLECQPFLNLCPMGWCVVFLSLFSCSGWDWFKHWFFWMLFIYLNCYIVEYGLSECKFVGLFGPQYLHLSSQRSKACWRNNVYILGCGEKAGCSNDPGNIWTSTSKSKSVFKQVQPTKNETIRQNNLQRRRFFCVKIDALYQGRVLDTGGQAKTVFSVKT